MQLGMLAFSCLPVVWLSCCRLVRCCHSCAPSNPDLLWQQPLVKDLSVLLEFRSKPTASARHPGCRVAVLTALIRLSNLWLNGRLAAAVCSDMSCEPTDARSISPMTFIWSVIAPRWLPAPLFRLVEQWLL